MSRRERRALTMIDLFCGMGLVSHSLAAQFSCVLANDWCQAKADLFKSCHPDIPLVVGDVTRLRTRLLQGVSLIWASSPCIDFSSAGRRLGIDGGRSSLVMTVPKMLRFLAAARKKPGVVVLENVMGFLTSNGGADFSLVVEALRACGYRVGAVVMDAERWLPMSRARVFMIAVLKGTPLPPGCSAAAPDRVWSTPTLTCAVSRLDDAARKDWIWFTMPEPPPRTVRLEDLIEDVPPGEWMGGDATKRFFDLLMPSQRPVVERIMQSGWRTFGVSVEKTDLVQPDEPWVYGGKTMKRRVAAYRPDIVFTLLASASGSSRQRLVEIHGREVRLRDLTPREAGRLMGVSDSLQLPPSIGLAMRALGDSVCVPVVKHLGVHLLEPLAIAAEDAAPGDAAPPEGWQRNIKSETVGMATYLLPASHVRLKRIAKQHGKSLHSLCLDAIDGHLLGLGHPPLQRYERKDAPPKRAGTRPRAAAPGRRKGVHGVIAAAPEDGGGKPAALPGGAAANARHRDGRRSGSVRRAGPKLPVDAGGEA